MRRIILGESGIEVGELCFGILPVGPLQKNVDVDIAARIIAKGLEYGIDFIDTAQVYKTYPHIKKALELSKCRPVIASKSSAASYNEMLQAVEQAREEMGVKQIDIFHLHAAKVDVDVFEVRKGAIECLKECKTKGIIRAVGIATHNPKVANLAASNPNIDIVFSLINKIGRGIFNGTRDEMESAIEKCRQSGKGVYLMKVLGGGTLAEDFEECVKYGRKLGDGAHPIALGMVSDSEVEHNFKYFNSDPSYVDVQVERNDKNVFIFERVCTSCENCIKECPNEAIRIVENGKARIEGSKCIQCGYCIPVCPSFAIRII